MSLPAGKTAVQLLVWLREYKDDPRYQHKFRQGTGRDTLEWLEGEKVANAVGADILKQRRDCRVGGYCVVEHGWDPSTVAPKKKQEVDKDRGE